MILSSELKLEHKFSTELALQALFFFVAVMAQASSVRAQQSANEPVRSSVDLTWNVPEQCPNRPFLVAEIEQLVGRSLDAIQKPSIRAIATIVKRDNETWVLRLRTREQGVEGEWELVADSCETLTQATALILALSIDPKAVETRERLYDQARRLTKGSLSTSSLGEPTEREDDAAERDEEVAESEDEASDQQDVPEPTETPADDEPRELSTDRRIEREDEDDEPSTPLRLGVLFRSGLVGDVGTLPEASIGAGAAIGLSVERVDLVVSTTWLSPNQTELAIRPQYGARFGLWTIGLGAYYRVFDKQMALAPCVIIDVGSMYGEGTGVTDAFEDSAFWFSMTAGLRFSWKLTEWASAGFEIGPKVPFLRPKYLLEIEAQQQRVHRSSQVVLSARGGMEIRL